MKRRSFLGSLLGAPVAVAMPAAAAQSTFTKPGNGNFGLVMVDTDVAKGDRLFCSYRTDGKTIDAWKAKDGKYHAVAIHDVSWEALDTGGKGITPAQLRVAVRFV